VATISTTTIGPGVLTLGAGGTAFSAEVRLQSFTVGWSESVSRTESRKFLSGDISAPSDKVTYSSSVSGKIASDFDDPDGLVTWSWVHRGTEQDFVYVPNSDAERAVRGNLRPIPLDFGGDVEASGPDVDFTWSTVGADPELGTYTAGVFTADA
jgi:hypothetical protein